MTVRELTWVLPDITEVDIIDLARKPTVSGRSFEILELNDELLDAKILLAKPLSNRIRMLINTREKKTER